MKKPQRQALAPLTPSELTEASMHVFYEVKMFVYCVIELCAQEKRRSKFTTQQVTHPDLMLRNVLLQAFGIHGKVLIDFFFGTNAKPDDIVAKDFGFTLADDFGLTEQLRDKVRTEADLKITHLVRNRISLDPNSDTFDKGHVSALLRLIEQLSKLPSIQSYPAWTDIDKLIRLTSRAADV